MMWLLPIVVSISSCVYFWLASDMHNRWKVLATAMVTAALAMQFTALSESVHFLVPLLMEIGVGLWGLFCIKLDQC